MSQQESLVVQPEQELDEPKVHNFMELFSLAIREKSAIDVIERLAALQASERDYNSRVSFDEALNRCQSKLERVSTDANNPSTSSRYATYAKLDKAVRPVYTAEGFSVSFGEKDCPTPGKTRFVAYLSRAGVTREYIKDLTPSTKGPKGTDMMTPIHADASADSYAKRYLLKDIFNIAIGENDRDGNADEGQVDKNWLTEQMEEIGQCETMEGLTAAFRAAGREALNVNDIESYRLLSKAKNARKKQLEVI